MKQAAQADPGSPALERGIKLAHEHLWEVAMSTQIDVQVTSSASKHLLMENADEMAAQLLPRIVSRLEAAAGALESPDASDVAEHIAVRVCCGWRRAAG
jgi:hypothetical protein